MILVDSSVWVDHFRARDPALTTLMQQRKVLTHPFVVGEVLLGNFQHPDRISAFLANIEMIPQVQHSAVMANLTRWSVAGRGIGWVDLHLLCSALAVDALFWTRDRRLGKLAEELGLRFAER